MTEEIKFDAETLPPGEYAIVEIMGHTTFVGRIAEVDRFGTKLLAIEPLFNGTLLAPIYQGGASIYRLTPCTPEVAWREQPREAWRLPAMVRATLPPAALPSPAAALPSPESEDGEDEPPLFTWIDEEPGL